MRAVDTNVLIRYLTGDDAAQAAKARAIIGQEPIFIPRTVMLEAEWVLRGVYEFASEQVIAALRAVAGLPGVTVEDAALVATALDWAEAGLDFADALHLAAAAGCEGFVTFDRRLVRASGKAGGVPVMAA
jgi:predicted nucleic-acid-binding protein